MTTGSTTFYGTRYSLEPVINSSANKFNSNIFNYKARCIAQIVGATALGVIIFIALAVSFLASSPVLAWTGAVIAIAGAGGFAIVTLL